MAIDHERDQPAENTKTELCGLAHRLEPHQDTKTAEREKPDAGQHGQQAGESKSIGAAAVERLPDRERHESERNENDSSTEHG